MSTSSPIEPTSLSERTIKHVRMKEMKEAIAHLLSLDEEDEFAHDLILRDFDILIEFVHNQKEKEGI